MPKWGLTKKMIDREPWDIPKDSGLLEPAKVVTDPVHGDIYLNRLEHLIINSRPMQRLRRVQQLGMAALVYPGATHTRFAHSLGALRAAQDLLDIVFDQRTDPHGVPDLFEEWQQLSSAQRQRQRAEVTVVARLGAVLHDLGHIPFGHSIEDDLGSLRAHDKNEARFNFLWSQLAEDLNAEMGDAVATLIDGPLYTDLRPLILSKEESGDGQPIEAADVITYPFVADIVGNTICADLIDYLARDHLYCGLPMALGHRFMSAFFVTPSSRTRLAERMALNIERDNRERTDIITELLKYLRYRYELTERVLVHHTKLAADAMVGKALDLWLSEVQAEIAAADVQPSEEREADRSDATLETVPGDDDQAKARKTVERRILAHGDDGLLEHLRDWASGRRDGGPEGADRDRLDAIIALIDALLRRNLFRLAGRSSTQQASAKAIYRDFGSPEQRRDLEQDAAHFAGIDAPWKIVLWVPPPDPRLKSADVLVFDGADVVEFANSELYAAHRGEDIYRDHGKLWAVSAYIDRSVDQAQRQRAAVRLAQRMEVRWDREMEELGAKVLEWPDLLAAREVCSNGNAGREAELVKLAREQQVARGPDDVETFDALAARYKPLVAELPER